MFSGKATPGGMQPPGINTANHTIETGGRQHGGFYTKNTRRQAIEAIEEFPALRMWKWSVGEKNRGAAVLFRHLG
jgi:hypothetical protein